MIRRACAFALLPLLAGCVTADVQLQPRHVEPEQAGAAVPACRLPPFTLIDARPTPLLGHIGAHEVRYEALPASVEAALRRAAATDAGAPPLQVELARAYLENHPSSHSFTLVLRARRDATAPWQAHRGHAGGVTWWGSDAEFGEYVRLAAERAASDLVAAQGVCEGA